MDGVYALTVIISYKASHCFLQWNCIHLPLFGRGLWRNLKNDCFVDFVFWLCNTGLRGIYLKKAATKASCLCSAPF